MDPTPPRRRVIGPVLGDDDKESPSQPAPPTQVQGPAQPPRRRMMGPVLDDDDEVSRKKDEEPVYEGPARPPSASKSSAEPPVQHGGKKRGLEPVSAGAFVGPPRPGARATEGEDEEEDEDSKLNRLRADEWEAVSRQQKVVSLFE